MDLNKIKNEKGITLIALAVTIVVLLILAGVTISSVFSENGIIKKAQQAENAIEKAKYNDLNEIAKLEDEINKYLDEVESVNEDEYATVNFQTYMGKFMRQKVDYERMRIEICDSENESDKIIFHIGTDWKEHIEKENDVQTQLYFAKNADLKMIQVLEHDGSYGVDSKGNKTISREMVSAFTDVVINNLKVKKDKEYTIKIFIQSASISEGSVIAKDIEVYTMNTGVISETEKNITIEKSDIDKNQYYKIFDADGDGVGTGADATPANQIASGGYGGEDLVYNIKKFSSSSSSEKIMQLIDSEGNLVNDVFVGFDYNRDGYITQNEGDLISALGLGFKY